CKKAEEFGFENVTTVLEAQSELTHIDNIEKIYSNTQNSSKPYSPFDQHNFYLGQEFGSDEINQIRNIVRAGGGSLSKTYDAFVTHYLVNEMLLDGDVKTISSLQDHIPIIVKKKWLVLSSKSEIVVSSIQYELTLPKKQIQIPDTVDRNSRLKIRDTRKASRNTVDGIWDFNNDETSIDERKLSIG
ncbi:hypothetical protein HK096_009049, partial [Nowakowskiella sp. JEL0078]